MEDLTGKTLDQYQIVGPLGEGGMAAVFKAYQPSMDRYVAVKVLPKHFASEPKFVQRFEREARIIAKLQHPHILPIHDFGQAEGYTYIVMPYIEAGTLAELLQDNPLPAPQIRRIIAQVGDALDYAHAEGVIHRDVKPSNIMLDERGNCLLMDFGIGKILAGSIQLTNTGDLVGTPAYMSPEQGLGTEIDGRSDIYSLGVMLYEMITGRAPFNAETPMAVVIKHIYDPLPPPREVKSDISEPIERVVLKALAKDRDNRFATPNEMVAALEAAYENVALPQPDPPADLKPDSADKTIAAPEGAPSKIRVDAQPQRKINPLWIFGVIATLVVIAVLGLIGLFVFGRQFLTANTSEPTATVVIAAAPATATPLPTLTPTLDPTPTTAPMAETRATAVVENQAEFDTEFPLPEVVVNFFSRYEGDSINFQTNITIEESIAFYREVFAAQGLTEREITTNITERTFSMVFDGHPRGLAIVVQGTDLDHGTTNINIRFEDI